MTHESTTDRCAQRRRGGVQGGDQQAAARARAGAEDAGASRAPRKWCRLRIDRDVLDFFQEDGPGWQDRINAALRKAAGK